MLARDARILRAAAYGRGVFEFTTAQGPVIAVNLQDGLDFETVCVGGREDLTLQIFNVGIADLVITSVQRLTGSATITVLPMPGTPLVIAPGEEVDFTVRYQPAVIGAADTTTIRIESNDLTAPVVNLQATAITGTGVLSVAIPDHGYFGEVCRGSFTDRDIVWTTRAPATFRSWASPRRTRSSSRPGRPTRSSSRPATRSDCGCGGCRECDHTPGRCHECGEHHRHDHGEHHHHHDEHRHEVHEDGPGEPEHAKPRPGEDPERGRCNFCHDHDSRCGTCQCCAQFRLVDKPFPTTLRPARRCLSPSRSPRHANSTLAASW